MAFLAAPAFTLPLVGAVSWGTVLSGASTLLGGLASSKAAAGGRQTAERNAQLAVQTAERNRLNAIRTAEINKQNLEQSAGQERAEAQRKALEQSQKQRLLLSRAAAVGAASGAGPMQENIFRHHRTGRAEQGFGHVHRRVGRQGTRMARSCRPLAGHPAGQRRRGLHPEAE